MRRDVQISEEPNDNTYRAGFADALPFRALWFLVLGKFPRPSIATSQHTRKDRSRDYMTS